MTGLKVGDKGQRFEVRCKNKAGESTVVGWAETQETADNLVLGVNLHPSFYGPEIIDRQEN